MEVGFGRKGMGGYKAFTNESFFSSFWSAVEGRRVKIFAATADVGVGVRVGSTGRVKAFACFVRAKVTTNRSKARRTKREDTGDDTGRDTGRDTGGEKFISTLEGYEGGDLWWACLGEADLLHKTNLGIVLSDCDSCLGIPRLGLGNSYLLFQALSVE